MPITSTNVHGKTITIEDSARQPCEIWSRCMGYYAVRSQYNPGKKSEFADRKYYVDPKVPDPQPTLFE